MLKKHSSVFVFFNLVLQCQFFLFDNFFHVFNLFLFLGVFPNFSSFMFCWLVGNLEYDNLNSEKKGILNMEALSVAQNGIAQKRQT